VLVALMTLCEEMYLVRHLNTLLFCRYLPPVPLTLRQAKNADVLPGQWYIPAGTILQMSVGPMMRYSGNIGGSHL